MTTASKVLVIGGGISGLACSWRLHQLGLPVLLLERSSRFGGVIDTIDQDGFRFDIGPQSFTNTPAVSQLIEELGLGGEVLTADPRAPRYILKHGRLVPAPSNPSELVMSSLLSMRTKLRIISEPFRRTRPPQTDESIAAFIRRKFGADLLENLVAPFVSGVWAGDPEKLSLRSSFPSIRQLEERHGSVIRGQIKQRRESGGKRASLCNFRGGLKTLVSALATKLSGCALTGAEITAIGRPAGTNESTLKVDYNISGATESVRIHALVMATPPDETARLLNSVAPRLGEVLRRIEYAGVAQVSAGYGLEQINYWNTDKGLEGFGFLVPRTEGLRLLGTVWNSSLFAERAPHGMASFTSFLGGTTDPEILSKSPDEIATMAHSELTSVLGLTDVPASQRVTRWLRALPQYHIGHQNVSQSLRDLCVRTPGIFLTGNYFAGPSIGGCVEHAHEVAQNVAQFSSTLPASSAAH